MLPNFPLSRSLPLPLSLSFFLMLIRSAQSFLLSFSLYTLKEYSKFKPQNRILVNVRGWFQTLSFFSRILRQIMPNRLQRVTFVTGAWASLHVQRKVKTCRNMQVQSSTTKPGTSGEFNTMKLKKAQLWCLFHRYMNSVLNICLWWCMTGHFCSVSNSTTLYWITFCSI